MLPGLLLHILRENKTIVKRKTVVISLSQPKPCKPDTHIHGTGVLEEVTLISGSGTGTNITCTK